MTKSFVIVADLSPLTVGHLLLLPRQHYLSFSTVVVHHLTELRELLDWLVPHYRGTFGEPVILEHGSAPDLDHGACITHAHWHLVPVSGAAILHTMSDDGLSAEELHSIANLGDRPWRTSTYFLVMSGDDRRVFHTRPDLRRQYLRSVISKPLGIPDPEWDYAVVVRKNYLRLTMARVDEWRQAGAVRS